jgi:hypothetical protein
MTAKVKQAFRVRLDAEFRSDPVFNLDVEGESLEEVVSKAKEYASELSAFTSSKGVAKLDMVNTHSIGIFQIPL